MTVQRDRALRMVGSARTPEAVEAAVSMLPTGEPQLRAIALARYEQLAAEPARRDTGAHVRAALLRAVRPVALPEDVGMLERAITTFEYLPPGPEEVAGRLRGTALVMLADLDERLAGFHAARLITNPDPLTSSMSDEPALTAVRVLAAQDQIAVLYGWLVGAGAKAPEAAAEALRAMTGAPASIVMDLIERMGTSQDEVLLLGLFDLLLETPDTKRFEGFVLDFLRNTDLIDLFGAVTATIIASRRERLIQGLRDIRDTLAREKALPLDGLWHDAGFGWRLLRTPAALSQQLRSSRALDSMCRPAISTPSGRGRDVRPGGLVPCPCNRLWSSSSVGSLDQVGASDRGYCSNGYRAGDV